MLFRSARLFSEPFGQGYPKGEAARKLRDTELLKSIRRNSQRSAAELLQSLDKAVVESILRKKNVIEYILKHGSDEIRQFIMNFD